MRQRLLALLLILPVVVGVLGWFVWLAYDQSLQESNRARLEATALGMMRFARFSADGHLELPDSLPEPDFNAVDGKLVARVIGPDETVLWSSQSARGHVLPAPSLNGLSAATPDLYSRIESPDGNTYEVLRLRVAYEPDEDSRKHLETLYETSFEVWQSLEVLRATRDRFMQGLLQGLAVTLAILGAGLLGLLHWIRQPLDQVRQELQGLKDGRESGIRGVYPHEIQQLTGAINELVHAERQQREVIRRRLGDLAHSLKTPLAVIRAELESGDSACRETLSHESERLSRLIEYQLKRTTGSRAPWHSAIPLLPVIRRLTDTLQKLYAVPLRHLTLAIPEPLRVRMDEDDLMEIMGNLLENAFKYGGDHIEVRASAASDGLAEIQVSDNGPGIPESMHEQVLQRGVRADSRPLGQGVGLALVCELLAGYGSDLRIDAVEGSGVRFQFKVPAVTSEPLPGD